MHPSTNKAHISLRTAKLDQSVAFYRAFFGREPVKLKPGYAKFELDDPGLNFTLNEVPTATEPGALDHLGIQVSSTAEVDAAKARLEASGMITLSERDTDCCYALQDKIWVSDPNGYRWEIFVVKVADTRPDLGVATSAKAAPAAIVAGGEDAACCAPACCSAD